jgi:hypothetical protein
MGRLSFCPGEISPGLFFMYRHMTLYASTWHALPCFACSRTTAREKPTRGRLACSEILRKIPKRFTLLERQRVDWVKDSKNRPKNFSFLIGSELRHEGLSKKSAGLKVDKFFESR